MKDTLNARFRAPLPDYYRRRIIVWKDEAGEFADTVADLHLENARVLTMRPNALFELRRQIEVDFADEDLLLYCPMAFERPEDNWLLDVFLYSEEFRADYWSLLFAELNIENTRPVREYAKTVSAFFASKERRGKAARSPGEICQRARAADGHFRCAVRCQNLRLCRGGQAGAVLRPGG